MRYIAVFLFISMMTLGFSQSKTVIVEKGIISQTIVEIDYSEGLDTELTESIEYFDKKGELIELKEFNSKGEIKTWEKYSYTEDGKIKMETFLNKKGETEKKVEHVYENGLKKEKLYYDEKDRLVKKKKYVYESK